MFNNFTPQNTACYLHNENKSVACGGIHKSTPFSFSAMATVLSALSSIAMPIATKGVPSKPLSFVDSVNQSDMWSTQFNINSTSYAGFSFTPPKFAYNPSRSQPKRSFQFEHYQQWHGPNV